MKKKQEDLTEFYMMIKPIICHPEFQKRKEILHHQESVYLHCLKVSLCAYKIAKSLKKVSKDVSIQDAVIAGLLHDFYTRPWREKRIDKRFFRKHGFIHGYDAAKNAYVHFPELMDTYIEDAIVKHMFPLTKRIPKYKESWIVTLADKIVSMEVFNPKIILPNNFKKNIKINRLDLAL